MNKINIQRLSSILDALTKGDRTLIQMKYAQNMRYADIGKSLGISKEAAKKRGQRILQKIKKQYMKEANVE
ncbi:MAG: sigma-70 family RNA polymerase sigma factor [Clostridiaceae bacterium]|nr:sigma-70 family RNA polymerase sigma factor [Clostridiaceae bacterium]